MRETFAQRLRSLRIENGYTQREMAKKLNVVQVSYLRWEQGKTEPNLDNICAICDIFNISADYLLGNVDEFGVKERFDARTQILTNDELSLIETYRKLTEEKKRAIFSIFDINYKKS